MLVDPQQVDLDIASALRPRFLLSSTCRLVSRAGQVDLGSIEVVLGAPGTSRK